MGIQVMEKSKERRPGFAIKGTTLNIIGHIMVTDPLVRIDGGRVGHLHGYKKNGGDLISLVCVEAADDLAQVDLSDLEVRVAVSLAVGI
jgi:hypothetical protein